MAKKKSKKNYHILSQDILIHWYELMQMGRVLDDKAPNYLKQAIGWSYHAPSAGHDGIQLALGLSFRSGKDFLFPYYRDLTTCLAAGLTPEEIILNGISKASDPSSGGRHMSNHFAKPSIGIQNVSSLTGNHAQHATGLARAVKTYNSDAIVFCSQGESSLSEGYCYEAIIGADREQLPVIFVIQDNGYGISVPKKDQSANTDLADNFSGLNNLFIKKCDGIDPIDSKNAMDAAIEYVRTGQGPAMVYAHCVRIGAHSNSDRHELYRSPQELTEAKQSDPLPKFRQYCLDQGISESALLGIETTNLLKHNKAHDEAMKAPNPDPESIFQFVCPDGWTSFEYPSGEHTSTEAPISMIQALNQTLKEEFRDNPDTYIWGQDMANLDKGGIFNVSKGMQQEFGIKRVFNAPIAEDFIVGTANGFSRFDKKIRVVIEGAEFADYIWPGAEQIVEMSHEYWKTNGQFSPNVTIRLASGGYIGGGLYHSQNIEGWLTTLPGIRVVIPAFADDAAGLLRTAMKSEGPTLYLEPKFLYNSKLAYASVPDHFAVPFGKARIRKSGHDLTVLAYGTAVHFALEAAQILDAEGHSIEVIDLRSLSPLDEDAILQSIKKTHRVVIAHEDKVFGGFGGELSGLIASKAFVWLDAPIERVGSEFTPVGFNRILERAILPNTEKVLKTIRQTLAF